MAKAKKAAPKKKVAPKKKAAKGKGGDDDGPDQGEMTGILQAHVDSLKQKLVL